MQDQNLLSDQEEDPSFLNDIGCFKLPKLSIINILTLILIILYTAILAELFIIFYFGFVGIISLTISLFLYEWLSLLTKDSINMIISIGVNLSNFGLFYALTLVCWDIIPDSLDITSKVFKKLKNFFGSNTTSADSLQSKINFSKPNVILICFLFLLCFLGAIFTFLVFALHYWIFIFSALLEGFCLALICLAPLFIFIKKLLCNKKSNKVEDDDDLSTEDFHINDLPKNKKKKDNNKEQLMPNNISVDEEDGNNNENGDEDDDDESILLTLKTIFEPFSNLNGMFDNRYKKIKFANNQTIYRIVIIVIISIFQLYALIYPLVLKKISISDFIRYFFIRLFFMRIICAYNLIDVIINRKRVLYSLNTLKRRLLYYVIFILHFCLIFCFIGIFIYSRTRIFPTIKSASFIENQQIWYKLDDDKIIPSDGFCFSQSQIDGSLKTEDLAMLTTLPRLYGTTKEGKCYLKPSMRGLFNTTMKYIFGKDYEQDGVRIFCKKLTHSPVLVITSEKILNQSFKYFSNTEDFTFFEKQFDIENKNYFDLHPLEKLPDKGQKLLDAYNKCVNENGTRNCEYEWDLFTQFYWPTFYTDDFADIPGFERYQINIDDDMVIQPSFISKDGTKWSGTHYIVGGSYEDSWGVGMLIETIGKNYVPDIFENLLPFYSTFNDNFEEVFLKMDLLSKFIFYSDDSCASEMNEIMKLYAQFNFTHESLFTVGHSISGTTFKGLSYLTDIKGIAFESSLGANNINLLDKRITKTKLIHSGNDIINIYSEDSYITEADSNCNMNGVLPKRYNFPSVYDTACMTTITCGYTMKYVPLCKQVLTRYGKDPVKEFNNNFENYLDFIAN